MRTTSTTLFAGPGASLPVTSPTDPEVTSVLKPIASPAAPVLTIIGPSAWINVYGGTQMIVIYADGRALGTPVTNQPASGEPKAAADVLVSNLLWGTHLDTSEVARLVKAAAAFNGLDFGRESVAGDETTTMTVNGVVTSIYALNYQGGGLTAEQIYRRTAIREFFNNVVKTTVNATPEKASQQGFIAYLRDVERPAPIGFKPKVWPLPVSDGQLNAVLSGEAVCITVLKSVQSNIGAAVDAIINSPSGRAWIINGKKLIVDVRLLLPHEQTCADDVTAVRT